MKYISVKEIKKVDKTAIEIFGISLDQMMENAGRNLARFIIKKFNPKRVTILFGKGNNGAGGLVAARHLAIAGVKVRIIGIEGNKTVKQRLTVLKNIGIEPENEIRKCDVIIDALLGYNSNGNPKGKFAELIKKANKSKAKIVSLDLPSGINPDNGKKMNPTINSDYVLTLALPKKGLKRIKNLYLINIGIPNEIYRKIGIKIGNYFKEGDIIKL